MMEIDASATGSASDNKDLSTGGGKDGTARAQIRGCRLPQLHNRRRPPSQDFDAIWSLRSGVGSSTKQPVAQRRLDPGEADESRRGHRSGDAPEGTATNDAGREHGTNHQMSCHVSWNSKDGGRRRNISPFL
ncbi:Hypothetical protein SMAX5B_008065 [Scophthalmus maximus]|uniref:Uncharacterized protein n=1 Tax=Scophthalmus maximus TaxID=52904 RepID=A0A2U9BDZ4_SCOMX|nr:Hypothetical protein SMAX5B_008065 [Scophthalmus maximus]